MEIIQYLLERYLQIFRITEGSKFFSCYLFSCFHAAKFLEKCQFYPVLTKYSSGTIESFWLDIFKFFSWYYSFCLLNQYSSKSYARSCCIQAQRSNSMSMVFTIFLLTYLSIFSLKAQPKRDESSIVYQYEKSAENSETL